MGEAAAGDLLIFELEFEFPAVEGRSRVEVVSVFGKFECFERLA